MPMPLEGTRVIDWTIWQQGPVASVMLGDPGADGPDSGAPAFHCLGLARSGIMSPAGEPDDEPLAIAGGIADQMGAIMLAYGIVTALLARERSGRGQEVDASHLGSMAWLQGLGLSARLLLCRP